MDPIIFPIDSPVAPDAAASTFIKNSGAEVPIAIIVKPTTKGDIPNFTETDPAPSTKISADLIINQRENTMIITRGNIEIF